MVYIGECEFCGRRNINPPNSDFFFTCHYGRTIVSCTDRICRTQHAIEVMEHELKTHTFRNYVILGEYCHVKVPRSDGSVSDGIITYEEGLPPIPCIKILNNDIMFYTEFSDDRYPGVTRCKHVSFSDLSNVNMHLPIIKIHQNDEVRDAQKKKLTEFQQALNNYCILTNKATRLVVLSHVKSDGSFSCLPKEIVALIITKYYQ